MKRSTVLFLSICLAALFLPGARLWAQAPPAGSASPRTAPAPQSQPVSVAVPESDAQTTREQLREILSRYPPDLGRVLKMDPTLLLDREYLARYPNLAAFLAAHPEVAHNPGYYLQFVRTSFDDYELPRDARSQAITMWRNTIEAISVFVVMVFIGGMLAWLVKTGLDHRRWLRLTKVQTEVHNKLLDRFAGTDELLAYVQTPAGRRFLEASPIPLDPGVTPRGVQAPLGRILWSVQAGVVMMVGGLGFQFVSGRVIEEVAQGLWMIGVLALAFGIGFILSGLISYVLSRRLGLLDAAPVQRGDPTAV